MTSLSMALIPVLATWPRAGGQPLPSRSRIPCSPRAAAGKVDAIVIGYGRVGTLVSEMLTRHGVKHVIVEKRSRVGGPAAAMKALPVYFGDATNAMFLKRCGIDAGEGRDRSLSTSRRRSTRSSTPCASCAATSSSSSRARDAEHARQLYKQIGVSDAVPETIEASLQLSEAALVGLGVPTGPVIASIHEKRDEFREQLQGAAGRPTRGLRASQLKRTP